MLSVIIPTEGVEQPALPRREPGEIVALREVWSGQIWYARPATVVRATTSGYVAKRIAAWKSCFPIRKEYSSRVPVVRRPRASRSWDGAAS